MTDERDPDRQSGDDGTNDRTGDDAPAPADGPGTGEEGAAGAGTGSGERLGDPLLRLSDVTSGYGDTRVLRGVSLDVGEGEVVALVGRNGAGKTTTLQTILGNLVPESGTITFDGDDVTAMGPEATVGRGIALVPEGRRIFPNLSVRENLELARMGGASVGGGVERDIDDVFDTFENLASHEDAAGSTLSGGEQQMLTIARALVGGGRLLLLDEPTEGLAPFVVQRVVDAVEDLRREGATVLLVEQNARVALDVADYVYILDKGRIVHQGPADELRDAEDVLDRYLGVSST